MRILYFKSLVTKFVKERLHNKMKNKQVAKEVSVQVFHGSDSSFIIQSSF